MAGRTKDEDDNYVPRFLHQEDRVWIFTRRQYVIFLVSFSILSVFWLDVEDLYEFYLHPDWGLIIFTVAVLIATFLLGWKKFAGLYFEVWFAAVIRYTLQVPKLSTYHSGDSRTRSQKQQRDRTHKRQSWFNRIRRR